MTAHRQPRTLDQATALCKRRAALAGEIAGIEGERDTAIAAANAEADEALAPLTEEMAQIDAKLQPWWAKNAEALTDGKRKSHELGGCILGTRAGRAVLIVDAEETGLVADMGKLRWAKPYLRTKTTLDRAAIMKAIAGAKHGEKLSALGFEKRDGEETFFVQRTEQPGTIGKS